MPRPHLCAGTGFVSHRRIKHIERITGSSRPSVQAIPAIQVLRSGSGKPGCLMLRRPAAIRLNSRSFAGDHPWPASAGSVRHCFPEARGLYVPPAAKGRALGRYSPARRVEFRGADEQGGAVFRHMPGATGELPVRFLREVYQASKTIAGSRPAQGGTGPARDAGERSKGCNE